MKNKRKQISKSIISLLTAVILLTGISLSTTASADYDVYPTSVTMAVKKKTVKKGTHFELYARVSPYNAEDDSLVWSIVKGKNIIRFEDYDRDGDEQEFVALKKGTAKVCCQIRGTNKKVYTTIVVKKASSKGTIKRIGPKTRTIAVGEDFDLEVRKSAGVINRNLKWSIKNTSVVRFDDYDRYGDDVEFRAVSAGTTKITCKNKKTKKSVSFTIKVVNRNNRYYDD